MQIDNWKFWVIMNMLVTATWAVFSRLTRTNFNAQTASLTVITFAWVTCFLTNFRGYQFTWNIGWLWAVLCGIMGGLTNITYYRFIKQAPFSAAMPLNEIYLFLIPILAFFVFGEGLTLRQFLGIGSALLTIFLLMK